MRTETSTQQLSNVANLVRRADPDRFLTTLFAPPAQRESLLLLYAFNHELARAREVASDPILALIRLQWWREVVEGARRRHEVAEPLGVAIATGVFQPADLLALVDAREIETQDCIETLPQWLTYLAGTAGGVMVTAARLLGARDPETLRPLGVAYGAAGVLRSVQPQALQGRCTLPVDILAEHGLTVATVVANPDDVRLIAVRNRLALTVTMGIAGHLKQDLGLDRNLGRAIAAALPVVLARRDLRRTGDRLRQRGLGDRLAVVWAGLTGRLS